MSEAGLRGRGPVIRLWVATPLPLSRVFLYGPKWKRAFGVTQRLIADVDSVAARLHRPGRTLWWYDFEDDVRELVLEEIRPGVVAQWSDPRERLR